MFIKIPYKLCLIYKKLNLVHYTFVVILKNNLTILNNMISFSESLKNLDTTVSFIIFLISQSNTWA